MAYIVLTIVLKPGSARRVDSEPDRPETGTGLGFKKIEKAKPGVTRSKTRLQTIDFCFFFY